MYQCNETNFVLLNLVIVGIGNREQEHAKDARHINCLTFVRSGLCMCSTESLRREPFILYFKEIQEGWHHLDLNLESLLREEGYQLTELRVVGRGSGIQ